MERVRAVLAESTRDLNCQTVIRPSNLGLAESVISGVTEVMQSFESVIVLEDDLIVSKDFLRFMHWGLRRFKEDQRVFSVTGFSFPSEYFSFPSNYNQSVFLSPRCNSWSWGTWRDRWERVGWGINEFEGLLLDRSQRERLNRVGWDFSRMLQFQKAGRIDSWAIRFCFSHFKHSAFCLHPVSTLVHNLGLDGTGTHSLRDRRFMHHEFFDSWNPHEDDELVKPHSEINDEIYRIFAGQNGPLLSRLRGLLSRSFLGQIAQKLVLERKSRARNSKSLRG